ncbi:MAG TPA: phosphotransferase [Pyrinomonadaceae bacterium]|nr:phosphotransferase [Pyrinomonadaceae bacterium]
MTPDTLSQWLGREVTDLAIDLELETPISKLVFLKVAYSAEAPADLPRHLVVKSPLKTEHSEVQFYRKLAPLMETPPVVHCLAALEDTCTIVLEDLRPTHDHPPWPLPPSRIQCERAVEALACVHAQWWESPKLGQQVGKPHTTESLTTMVKGIASHLPSFIDTLGDAFTLEARKIYERVFSSSLKPWLRLTNRHALTVIHGDAHAWNFLFPRAGDGPAFLFDWQLWHVDVGARDLAFLMVHWYPNRRRELERPLIRQYYEAILARDVNNYAFDELWLDYRRCAVRNLTLPIIFWERGMKPEFWWHRLQAALEAYRDLDCDELL